MAPHFTKALLAKPRVPPALPPRAPGSACLGHQRPPTPDVALPEPCKARPPPCWHLPPFPRCSPVHPFLWRGRAGPHICTAQLAGHIWMGYSPKTPWLIPLPAALIPLQQRWDVLLLPFLGCPGPSCPGMSRSFPSRDVLVLPSLGCPGPSCPGMSLPLPHLFPIPSPSPPTFCAQFVVLCRSSP